MNDYIIATQRDLYAGKWLVIRVADRRIMTEGAVTTCIAWLNTWAPMDRAVPKRGRELSDRFVIQ